MTDQELAEALFELRVVSFNPAYECAYNTVAGGKNMNAEQIVRDWRVAGALMEKLTMEGPDKLRTVMGSYHPTLGSFEASVSVSATNVYGTYLDRSHESLPRAIIEACCNALE